MNEEFKHKVICGICQFEFGMSHTIEERDGCTTDCPECGGLLMCLEDGSTAPFHEWLHEQSNGDWPKDGQGTGRVIASAEISMGGAIPFDFGDPMNEDSGEMCCDNPDFDFPENLLMVKTPSLLCKNCNGEMFLRWNLVEPNLFNGDN